MTRKITEEGAPLPRRRAVRLVTSRDARAFLSKIINGVYRDEMSPGKASRIGYLLGIMLRSIENDEQRWASSDAQPSPATIASKIRECMRAADAQVPGPPGQDNGT